MGNNRDFICMAKQERPLLGLSIKVFIKSWVRSNKNLSKSDIVQSEEHQLVGEIKLRHEKEKKKIITMLYLCFRF